MISAAPQPKRQWQRPLSVRGASEWRVQIFRYGLVFFALFVTLRLGVLQVLDHETYAALASGQHTLFRQLYPERGHIYVHDAKDGTLVPLAMNQTLSLVYANPRLITDAPSTAARLGSLLGYDQTKIDALAQTLGNAKSAYRPIEHRVSREISDAIAALKIPGIALSPEETRLYPEPSLGGHVVGFLGSQPDGSFAGKYGIEGYFNKELAGTPGSVRSEKDISGRLITIGERSVDPAQNGADVVLTIDRTIQYRACAALHQAVLRHQADGGSVIIMEPSTGRILAMCGDPDFDPNNYRAVPDIRVFNNPSIFGTYEPGSIFKAITLAAGLDSGALLPTTTYEDTGEVKIDRFTIRNSDGKAHGLQTMTEALDQSLNLGMIWAMRKMGKVTFGEYVKKFGFGQRADVELDTESPGDISSLDSSSEIYAATASYGQGITVTPLQMIAAYAAMANGGILRTPYIVDEIRHADGTVEQRHPTDVRRVIDTRTARLLGAMLVSVIENGHGKRAGVPGFYIAGKTGTAQVARKDGPGYEEDKTMGSFAGFGPVEDPKFAMIVRIDNPKDVTWAESSAAPLFGEIASFLVKYMEIPPTRPQK